MRDGRQVLTRELEGLAAGDLVRAMVGRELAERPAEAPRHAGRAAAQRGAADPRGRLHRHLLHRPGRRDRRAGRAGGVGPQRGGSRDLRHRPVRRGRGDRARAARCAAVHRPERWRPGWASCPRTAASRAWSWTCRCSRTWRSPRWAAAARRAHPGGGRARAGHRLGDPAEDQVRQAQGPGVHAVRRQPAEGRAGQVAGPQARGADRGRAHPRASTWPPRPRCITCSSSSPATGWGS